ncbi:hypothetical protein FQA39_LY04136 [Lamprigera yunnana]|nr:hypothetical protein FQA39_LY04136 [Lamprigera yunnana]
MELRSSRSRSRTPFMTTTYDMELNEDQAGLTSIRTTRSSTKIMSKSIGSSLNNHVQSVQSKSMKTRSYRSEEKARKARYKTSDYSSEEGEPYISSTLEYSNNDLKDDSRNSSTRSTGSASAIDYYRAAGDYWNKYPKTDYTYSLNSRDKTEIAPGVVAMPNMSRRSLHGSDASGDFIVAHKHTNTEESYQHTPIYSSNNEHVLRARRGTLFANNNYNAKSKFSTEMHIKKSFFSKVTSVFITIFMLVFSTFYYIYRTHNFIMIKFAKVIHKVVTRFMLWDTWLLRSLKNKDKVRVLLAVCLIPLLLFGGWWLLSQIGPLLQGKNQNYVHEKMHTDDEKISAKPSRPNKLSSAELQAIADIVRSKLTTQDVFNEDLIAEKIVQSPNFQNLMFRSTKVSDDQTENVRNIDPLRTEISKIRFELLQLENSRNRDVDSLIAQLRADHAQNIAKLTYKVNRCCRNSVIQTENHIMRILKELFQAPVNLGTFADISQWLRSTFVAKEDLEARLNNLTQNLHSNFDVLIRDNSEVIMDKVMSRITVELNQRLNKVQKYSHSSDITIDSLTDDYIKKIVEESLAVYDADKTGLVDYALESAGGEILTIRCTESYQTRSAVLSVYGFPIWYPVNTARTVITPGVVPGECWAFQSFPAFVMIKLASRITVTAFSLEHISKLVAINGNIDSAPKEFYVYGLKNEADLEPMLFGVYFYDQDGPPLQYFTASPSNLSFNIVELKIVSNHGHPNYTCLYRFRVHGTNIDAKPT